MNRNDRPLCQVPGCRHRAVRAVEVDLPASWEATQNYTTLTVTVGLCCKHAAEVSRRVAAALEARSDLYNLITIVETAVRFEKALELRLEMATDLADRLELENGGLRQTLRDADGELGLVRKERSMEVAALSGTVVGCRRALAEAFNSGDRSCPAVSASTNLRTDPESGSTYGAAYKSERLNRQRGSDGAGEAIGWALLVLLILAVAFISTTPHWLAGNVQVTYQQCMAAAQTVADQKQCDPTQPTPGTKP